ncbi:hypothetical protein QQP08_007882 [Theobroma cacao]|uniref:Uncharacterized protein LOC18608272 n=1 Tax=Theobroma cacao TaxID=3641 RepID=A0AB32VJH0_THECC|nr:PREDICTED: uncharacterized protein LOC18608272 [Theobroma cacao]WRX15395.1 hypothetical protein QQP08_007882 [Theobroma cacao]
MGIMENSPTAIAPLLLRNMVTSIFIYADKSLLNLAGKYKLLELIRAVVITFFLFFLRLLPSLIPSTLHPQADDYTFKHPQNHSYVAAAYGVGDSGIARALSQLLSIVNDIPVSSRKYEIVRSLAERLIEENRKEDVEALREVNRTVLSAAFARTLRQLEAAMVELGQDTVGLDAPEPGPVRYRLNRVLRAIRSVGDGVWSRVGMGREDVNRSGNSAQKLAAELLWLAQKLAACGFEEEAVERWASTSKMAWLSLSAEPRVQCSLVKVSAFLFKQAKDMGLEVEETEEGNKENLRQTKLKMLTSWLPLLCRASNGTDAPVLSISERAELEKLLEETIEMLEQEEQEQVLSLWLHHFTHSPSSDWPNLHESYARWCTTSRKLLLLR